MTSSQRAAVAAAVAKAAREKRQREQRPGDAGSLQGQYRGQHRGFSLVWVAEECGYRRRFADDGRWRWDDPTIYSAEEIRGHTTSRLWTRERTWPAKGQEMVNAAAERTPHQKRGFTEETSTGAKIRGTTTSASWEETSTIPTRNANDNGKKEFWRPRTENGKRAAISDIKRGAA